MSGITAVGYFLLSLFFSMLTFVLWARFGLRYFRVSSLHPASQLMNSITAPVLKPVEGFFKSSNIRANRYDWACLSVLIAVEFLKFITLGLLFLKQTPSWFILPINVLADLIIEPCNLLFYAIIIRIILSWVNPNLRNPLTELIFFVTEPLLKWARRVIPPTYGLDLSAFLVMIGLKVITLFIGASVASPFI